MRLRTFFFWMTTTVFIGCTNHSNDQKQAEQIHTDHVAKKPSRYADSVNAGLIAVDTMKSSTPRVSMATIGNAHVHISYYSPGVKGRIIWGGLVPYNTVWVTGAHSATSMSIDNPIIIDDKKIEAGTYAIFTIPGEQEWIFILNKNYQQHLADDYSEQEDVLRFIMRPVANEMTQRLTYKVVKHTNNKGRIEILWDKLKLIVPFETTE
jgi:hypothetical protein